MGRFVNNALHYLSVGLAGIDSASQYQSYISIAQRKR